MHIITFQAEDSFSLKSLRAHMYIQHGRRTARKNIKNEIISPNMPSSIAVIRNKRNKSLLDDEGITRVINIIRAMTINQLMRVQATGNPS